MFWNALKSANGSEIYFVYVKKGHDIVEINGIEKKYDSSKFVVGL